MNLVNENVAKAAVDKKRIDWVDCAKGIAIILVLIGHTVTFDTEPQRLTRGIIFSFHMPLFFIMSSMTFRFSENTVGFTRKTKKAFSHLIIPFLILFGIRIGIDIAKNFSTIDPLSYISFRINQLVYSSGVEVKVGGGTIAAIGMLWFLVVLFCSRTLFDYLHLKLKTTAFYIVVAACSAAGLILGYIQWLPLSFDVALAIFPLLLFGVFMKRINIEKLPVLFMLISLGIWAAGFFFMYYGHYGYMELSARRYTLFPLCYIVAIAGTMFVSYSGHFISKVGVIGKGLIWLGKYSLYLYMVHELDGNIKFLWEFSESKYVQIPIRIAVDVIICIALVKIIGLINQARKKKYMAEK